MTGARSECAVLALGSNLGDRLARLRDAARALDAALGLVAASAVYETVPVGGPAQDDYLNAVLLVRPAPPRALLAAARAAEAEANRVRTVRWGPRTLDVDVIAVGEVRSDDPEILLPHPRAHLRAFVCVPWLDVDPAARIPGHGPVAARVAALAAEAAGPDPEAGPEPVVGPAAGPGAGRPVSPELLGRLGLRRTPWRLWEVA